MIYGYARCSTNESKQDIKRQKRELEQRNVKDANIFFEYESGSKTDRIQLARLLDTIQPGDTIVTTEVSRLTRSTKQLCEIIEIAKEKKLQLIIGTFNVDCRKDLDPMTDGMLKMMGVFAEMEREMIRQRIKSGVENAKAKGVKLGRPGVSADNLPEQFLKHYPKYASKQITQEEFGRLCDLTRQTIAKYVKLYRTEILCNST